MKLKTTYVYRQFSEIVYEKYWNNDVYEMKIFHKAKTQLRGFFTEWLAQINNDLSAAEHEGSVSPEWLKGYFMKLITDNYENHLNEVFCKWSDDGKYPFCNQVEQILVRMEFRLLNNKGEIQNSIWLGEYEAKFTEYGKKKYPELYK